MKSLFFAFSLLLILQSASAQHEPIEYTKPEAGNLSYPELLEIAATIRELQKRPEAVNAGEVGADLVEWLTSSPNVIIALCPFPTTELTKWDNEYASMLFAHQMLGMAAFMLESPSTAQHDPSTTVIHGLESTIEVYRYLHDKYGDEVKSKFLNKMIKRQEKGTFEKYVRKKLVTC